MKITFLSENRQQDLGQWIPGLGYIQRDGSNFLPAIVRLEELLSGTLKAEKTSPKISSPLNQTLAGNL